MNSDARVTTSRNPNTPEYWENRFASGHWGERGGQDQTTGFAEAIVPRLKLAPDFGGSLLDFGCAMGDALDVYARAFPKAKLFGVDISSHAITACKERFGHFAEFIAGGHTAVPPVDVITTCAVLEHLDNDVAVVQHLLTKCRQLHVTVPYREPLGTTPEHVNSYDTSSFRGLAEYSWEVFPVRGWSQFGRTLWVQTYGKNLLRPLLRKKLVRRAKMITFHFTGRL